MLAADDQRKFEKGPALDYWRQKFFVSQVCLTLYFGSICCKIFKVCLTILRYCKLNKSKYKYLTKWVF